jgi:hypothetical protein
MQLPQCKGRPVRDPNLGVDVMKMNLDGAFLEVELTTNLLVRKAKGNQIYDFPLAWRQDMTAIFALWPPIHASLTHESSSRKPSKP